MSNERPAFPISIEELRDDVYFSPEWVELDLLHSSEGEGPFEFFFHKGEDHFLERTVKHRISEVGGATIQDALFDLQSPYGFGGPLTNSKDPEFVSSAYKEYEERALNEGVVASFIRFHPFDPFPYDHEGALDLCSQERSVVHIPFEGGMERVFADFRSSLRRNVRKALKEDLRFEVSDKNPSDRAAFIDLYRETMQRIGAPGFYYFTEDYFEELFDRSFSVLSFIKDGQRPVNALLLLKSGPMLYYHLGATAHGHYSRNVNPLNFYHCIRWGIEEGYRGLCLGGGASRDPEDPLFKFKRKFSPQVWPFYIGGKIFDRQKYDVLIEMREQKGEEAPPQRFLKYRF